MLTCLHAYYVLRQPRVPRAAAVRCCSAALVRLDSPQPEWLRVQARERVRLVVINPSFVFGPVLSGRADSTSVKLMRSLLESTTPSAPPGCFGLTDVRDVLLPDGRVTMCSRHAKTDTFVCRHSNHVTVSGRVCSYRSGHTG